MLLNWNCIPRCDWSVGRFQWLSLYCTFCCSVCNSPTFRKKGFCGSLIKLHSVYFVIHYPSCPFIIVIHVVLSQVQEAIRVVEAWLQKWIVSILMLFMQISFQHCYRMVNHVVCVYLMLSVYYLTSQWWCRVDSTVDNWLREEQLWYVWWFLLLEAY